VGVAVDAGEGCSHRRRRLTNHAFGRCCVTTGVSHARAAGGRTEADAASPRESLPLVVGLRDTLGWSVAYEDDCSVVLVPPTTAD